MSEGADLTGAARGNQVMGRATSARVRLAPLFAMVLWSTACGADHEVEAPSGAGAEAAALARLELGALRLRPAASVGALPTRRMEPPDDEGPPGLSIGPPQRGELLGGRELSPRPGLALLPSALRRGATWGTPALVGLIERAAAAVDEDHPGSTLWVGDLSKRTGGPFAPHASHQSGRDVDLAFYLSTPGGGFADPPQMAAVSGEGRSGGLEFDLERNWRLVEAMLSDDVAQVQWIFVANHIRAALLDHGRRVASPLVARAERVLLEPRDSSPHADHYHVRIYCGLDDRLNGCLDAPPFHPWVDRHEAAVSDWLAGLLPLLERPHQPETGQAIEAIVRMNASSAIPELSELAERANDPVLAEMARDAVAFLSGRRTREGWERWRPRELGH